MLVTPENNPKITDTVLFTLTTTDENGTAVNPYKVNQVIIYFIERGFTVENNKQLSEDVGGHLVDSFFKDAVSVTILGDDFYPAWLSSDTDNAFISKEDFDDEGNPQIGVFSYEWTPDLKISGEGDYVICWTWTPIAAGDSFSNSLAFNLYGDTSATTSIPTHFTPPQKYEVLLDRYTPEMFKLGLGDFDLTPDVLDRTNSSIASGFTVLEDMTNQIVDLIDANVLRESLLSYLSNLFSWKLKSSNTALWRRQIKRAIPLYKKKGTLDGLAEALSEAGMELVDFTQLWQVVSPYTWQEAFVFSGSDIFTLSKLAILDYPIDTLNFELYVRLEGTDEYVQISLDYVSFSNFMGVTTMTWIGDNLSVNPLSLQNGDIVRIIYKVNEFVDQTIEDFIRTLSLADQRDETTVTYPLKNWNVRVITENDPMFDVVCPQRNPFHDPVVFGKVRTEFPYSENIYNMDEYNGSIRDSTNPCDLDKNFLDSCSCCLGSKFNITVEVQGLDPDRMSEALDVIKDFVPFHAIIHNINFIGSQIDFTIPPIESIEALITFQLTDNMLANNFDFNRLIEEGSSDADELKRNMLATATVVSSPTGTGKNSAIVLFSPGIQFNTVGIDTEGDNLLEIISGSNQGKYKLLIQESDRFVIDILQGVPNTISFPLDASAFPFRVSNLLYSENSTSIYQDDIFEFGDSSIGFANLGTQPGWKIAVTSGIYVGTYTITDITPDNTVIISGWLGVINASSISYQLKTNTNAVVVTSSGRISVSRQGRLEIQLVTQEFGIHQDDYVLYGSTQYKITHIAPRGVALVDKVYISGYTGGNVVGLANITIYRRIIDSAVGYVGLRGLKLTGTIPAVDGTLENNTFLDNYFILIGTSYYQITSIDGSTMTLSGPMLSWGLTGTSVSYSIIKFIKTSPITTQDGTEFYLLDRRDNDSIVIDTETSMSFSLAPEPFSFTSVPLSFTANILNNINTGTNTWVESVRNQESITIDIVRR